MSQTSKVPRIAGNGEPSADGRDSALEPQGGRRWSQAAVGIGVAVAAALVAVLLFGAATNRRPVLAVAEDIGRGEVVEQADLRTAYVGGAEDAALVGEDQVGEVVGKRAVADLTAGTLLGASMVDEGPELSSDEGLVGVPVAPEAMPDPGLAVGDTVEVVRTGETSGQPITTGEVASITAVGDSSGPAGSGQAGRVVSLQVPADAAPDVAAAAAAGEVRLIQMPPSGAGAGQ